MSSILSSRGNENIEGLNIPWRFAPPKKRYDKETCPDGLIFFSNAENAAVQQKLEDFVNEKVKIPGDAFLYRFSTAGGPAFPRAMASFLNDHFHPHMPVKPEEILTACGVTPITNMLALNLGDPGDGILVSSPIYGRFELDTGNEARLQIIYAEMKGVGSFEKIVVDRFEAAIQKARRDGIKIRALLISNPSNPLGRCYPRETLEALMKFCHGHKIHLISDEIYGLSVYDTNDPEAVPFTSILSIDTTNLIDPEYVQVMYGMSKDFGSAGLRLGCLITRCKLLLDACTSLIRFHSPSGPSIAIGTAILSDREFTTNFLSFARSSLASGYHYTISRLEEAGIKYHKGTNAGFFVFIDLSPYLSPSTGNDPSGEFGLAQHLIDHGVFLQPGEEHFEEPGWFRLVFGSTDRETLTEGLRREEDDKAEFSMGYRAFVALIEGNQTQ